MWRSTFIWVGRIEVFQTLWHTQQPLLSSHSIFIMCDFQSPLCVLKNSGPMKMPTLWWRILKKGGSGFGQLFNYFLNKKNACDGHSDTDSIEDLSHWKRNLKQNKITRLFQARPWRFRRGRVRFALHIPWRAWLLATGNLRSYYSRYKLLLRLAC